MKKILSALLVFLCLISFNAEASEKESAYERVMRTGTIRCGYILLPPEMMRDVNTNEFSGLSYDIWAEIARRLNLKIDWTEEVNFQGMTTGLENGRYDAVCFSLYRYTGQIPVADFSVPLFYSGTGIFVRSDDNRFDNDISSINDPNITISTVDGEMAQFIAAEDFPAAKTMAMPQFTDLTMMMKNVETKKADVAFVNNLVAEGYLQANPGKLKNIAADNPLRLFSHGFMFPKGEYDFVKMIDLTLSEMHDHGTIEKILDKYDPSGSTYFRVSSGYKKGR